MSTFDFDMQANPDSLSGLELDWHWKSDITGLSQTAAYKAGDWVMNLVSESKLHCNIYKHQSEFSSLKDQLAIYNVN